MALEDSRNEPTTHIVQRVIDDVRELFREEVALARAEVREEFSAWSASAIYMAGGAIATAVGGLFVLHAIAQGIAVGLDWPVWTGYLIVGVVLTIVGIAALAAGRARAKRIATLPKTTETVKETSAWIKDRMTSKPR